MTSQDINHILQALNGSRAELHTATEGLNDEQTSTRPAPDRWSVLDCVEHLFVVEGRVLARLENPEKTLAPAASAEREQKLTSVEKRDARFSAPEAILPVGRFTSLTQALDSFDAARTRTIAFANSRGAGVYSISIVHPVFGPVNGADTLILAAAHTRRHIDQIREVRVML